MVSLEEIMKQTEIGYASHRLVYDESGKPVDYIFLNVNQAFERLTGYKKKEILKRKITEVMPEIIQGDFNWIDYYGAIAQTGQRKVIERHFYPLDKWFRVEAFSCEKGCFTTLFTDITHQRELTEASKDFLNDGKVNNTYEEIAQRMKRITGADYVALNIFLEEECHFQTVAITGIPDVLQKGVHLLGFNPEKKEWSPDPARLALIKNQRVTTFDHLHELTNHVLSKQVIQLVEKTLNLGQTVIIKSTQGETMIGDFTLMFTKGKALQNENEAIIYADMVGMLIENRKGLQKLEEKENDLQKAKDDLQTISDNMLDLVSVTDLKGNYQFVGASHQILGYDIEELIGRNVMEFVHPEDFSQVQAEFEAFIQQKTKTAKAIYRYRCADDSYLWFETLGTIVSDNQGEPKEILFNTRDITKQKEMEVQLKEKQIRLELAMDSSQHGFWDKNLDTGEIFCSPRFYTMLGYEPDEFKMTADIWQSLIHPDDRSFFPNLQKYLENQEQKEHHFRVKCKDDHYKWISSKAKGHERDSQGIPHRAVGVHVDIDELKRKTEALKESHRMAKMGRWDYYHKQDILQFSEGVFNILEVVPEKAPANYPDYLNKLHPDDRKAAAQEWEESVGNHQSYDTEYRLMLSNGQVKWIASHCYTEYDKDGHPQHSVGILQDITEQKQQQEELEQFFSVNLDLLCIADTEGRFVKLNKEWEKTLGYSLKELKKRKILDFVHPDDLDATKDALQTLENQEKVLGFVNRYKTKDGRFRYLEWRSSPSGKKIYAAARDITEHMDTEMELSCQKETAEKNWQLLNSIISALPGLLLVIDQQYHIILANKNRIQAGKMKYDTIDQVIGKKCYEAFMNRESPCPWCQLEKVIETGQTFTETTTPDDPREKFSGKALRVLTAPISDSSNHVIGAVEYGVDVTELRNAQIAAQQANEAKSAFLANMSHELRTPLNGIIGFSDMMKYTPLNEEQKSFVDVVHSSAKHLSEVISDILDFSRIEAGKFELFPEKTDFRKLIEETLSIVQFRAESKGLTLCNAISTKIPKIVEVDGPRLKQILVNLLTNAIKFTNEGRVQLIVNPLKRESKWVYLNFKVIDTGIGIKEKDQVKIFEPFHQADMPASKRTIGTGLGLAITKDLLEKMGSSLHLESVYKEGSTFSFHLKLPCEAQQTQHPDTKDDETFLQASLFKHKKILIVEDNPVNRQYAQKALSMMSKDIQILVAENGQAGYDQYRKHHPDLILMDILMPQVSGFEATAMIRSHDKQVPIIAMTAKALKEDREACLAAGMNDFITKPVSLVQLRETLEKHLR